MSDLRTEMPLTGRERDLVQLVSRFRQLTAKQANELLFYDRASKTPCDRTLKRLTERNYLNRIERRMVGGAKGGSGQYVYSLGRRGFFMHSTGRYNPARNVNYHALAIVDCFIQLKRLERAGRLRIVARSTEPDCWQEIAGVTLKPDMYVELEYGGQRHRRWYEVDMGSEAQRQLRGKLEAYWRAWSDASAADVPVFPKVVWVAVDAERAAELKWLIEQGPADAQELFEVVEAGQLYTGS